MSKREIAPVHPGEVLREDFLSAMGISEYRLAKAIGVPARRINEITHGKRAVTADTALRLAKFFRTDAQSWMNLQTQYDLILAKEDLEETLAGIEQAA